MPITTVSGERLIARSAPPYRALVAAVVKGICRLRLRLFTSQAQAQADCCEWPGTRCGGRVAFTACSIW